MGAPDEGPHGPGPIRGDLIRWARQQQELSLVEVRNRGGPGPSYQSEVENGIKKEVHSETLHGWTEALGVNEPFVRGGFARYHIDPGPCRGLAGEVGRLALASPQWPEMAPTARARHLLHLAATGSERMTELVLAYVLDLDKRALEDMIAGHIPIPREQVQAIADITSLNESQVLAPPSDRRSPLTYESVVARAREVGITPETLLEMVEQGASPAARDSRAAGSSPRAGGIIG